MSPDGCRGSGRGPAARIASRGSRPTASGLGRGPKDSPGRHQEAGAMILRSSRAVFPSLFALALAATSRDAVVAAASPEDAAPRPKDDGYRGIWYSNQPTGDRY